MAKKKTTKKSKRKHLPVVSPAKLRVIMENLAAQEGVTPSAKAAMTRIFQAASNPDAESPQAIIASLPQARQADVIAAVRSVGAPARAAAKRGRDLLMALDDAEWDRLVDEAAGGEA